MVLPECSLGLYLRDYLDRGSSWMSASYGFSASRCGLVLFSAFSSFCRASASAARPVVLANSARHVCFIVEARCV